MTSQHMTLCLMAYFINAIPEECVDFIRRAWNHRKRLSRN